MKKPILLSPVGSWEMFYSSIEAGCDAIYLGIKGINMRERANNFTLIELKKLILIAHKKNIKVYLTLNTIIFETEIKKIENIIKKTKKYGIDAIIAWDLSVISLCNKYKIKVHLSTQASVSNSLALEEYYKKGVKRFVLARELSLEQIKQIIKHAKKISKKIEIETFIHGAMCVSISGRCFLSQFLYGNKTSANRGKCIQPCRREYLIKDKETGKELDVYNNYILSPKDLSTIKFIDKLIYAGIEVFKIEGRARSPEYVKVVTRCYRKAIDLAINKKLTKKIKDKLEEELKTVYNRGFSDGFYMGYPLNEWNDTYGTKATKRKIFLGKICKIYKKINVAEIKMQDNSFKLNDTLLIIGPKTGVIEEKITSIQKD
ncbi:MAG: U32 family peptidase, partial [Candidatus ainarchaeum sp.]|nr:U32 family peptidase [Candidatus ainarchaeum sp.]